MLEVELGADADLSAPADAATSHASIGCDGALVRIEIDDAITRKQLRRSLDLGHASPSARARVVALAVAELLAASWLELGMRRPAELDDAAPHASSEERRAIALDLARARLMTGALPPPADEPTPVAPRLRPIGIRAFAVGTHSGAEPAHFSVGGGLGMDAELLAPLAILLDVRAEHSSAEVGEFGSVTTQAAWAGALLALRLPWNLNHTDFGVGVRGGVGWLEGSGTRGVHATTQVGPLVSLISAVHLSLHVAHSAYVHLGVELGWVVAPVYGTLEPAGQVIAQVGGFQAALSLGFEVRPE